MTKDKVKQVAPWVVIAGTILLTYLDNKIGLWWPDRFTQEEATELEERVSNICDIKIKYHLDNISRRTERVEDWHQDHLKQHGK